MPRDRKEIDKDLLGDIKDMVRGNLEPHDVHRLISSLVLEVLLDIRDQNNRLIELWDGLYKS